MENFYNYNMDTLETKARETIQKYDMLSHGNGVLAAVSGGPDSVALLHLLYRLRGELGLRLEVAHLQHGIRGEEARQDARFVAEMAERLALRFHLREVDLPRVKAEKGRGNLEAMAREERYGFFAELAQEHGLLKVALAHTRDDQAETLLLRLLRGSGRRGLAGMPPVRCLIRERTSGPWLIRPLIESSRKEILSYLMEHGLLYQSDRTNFDPGLLRNWVRLVLLPQLEEKAGPRLAEGLARVAEILRDEEEILDRTSRERLQRVLSGEKLLCALLLEEEKAMQRRLIRLWLEAHLGDLRGIGFHHVEDVLRFIAKGRPQGVFSLPKGWRFVKQYGSLRLERKKTKRKTVSYSYVLPLHGELIISEAGMKIRATRGPVSFTARPQNDLEAIFDLARLPETLTVRNFHPGDRFQPLGMRGHKKVKDLFIERKVPLSLRRTLPLLLAGGEILWIPCCGRSDVAKVRAETTEVLKVSLVVEDSPEDILN
jgi:tRNA(Ile)-lysidine synthase